MSKEDKKSCGSKRIAMFGFALTTLATRTISAISLAAIALGVCSMSQKARLFNDCVDEIRQTGQTSSNSVRFCKGG